MTAKIICEDIITELGLERRCTRCGEFYPLDHEFYFENGRGDFRPYCKACELEKRIKVLEVTNDRP